MADAVGEFLEPDPALEHVTSLHDHLEIEIKSGHRADLRSADERGGILTRVADAIDRSGVGYEDQCSARHYADVVRCIEQLQAGPVAGAAGGSSWPARWSRWRTSRRAAATPAPAPAPATRIVDVGVFMGGTSAVFAGCAEELGLSLDLVDTSPTYLRFTHERLRRAFPKVAKRVRMFHGDLPTYVREVLMVETAERAVVHHDGAHEFDQVVRDLASLWFVRDRVPALAVQDTHLRCSDLRFMCFVDAAVFAVFGPDPTYRELGVVHEEVAPLTSPDRYFGNYCLPGVAEGMFLELAQNRFRFPHPTMPLEALLRR
ncbi:hypothetical protein Acsp06_27580 [Actinomycetospora sp. NBRC 106375]|uniref:class I SAM-dependent methyltransferase n=1 Tax=Actinomycetospora sp. NBRC 106375 TaxID=3032207 RepID=UPI0024A58D47|nr:class I SAM-dependent methyltransferase [Actinomycetospora sp. NBRC 106375]GLZ46573.1 hypothetical protein Acsp06_27580 [Actinomycetospora sp. NBRC 106375]